MSSSKKKLLFVLGPIVLTPFILFLPLLLAGKVLFWGTPFLQFTPWRDLAWKELIAGQLPLWNPWVGMGAPLAANYQSALFYPPNWLLIPLAAAFGPAGIAWGQTLLAVLHLVWAGIGMALLVRQLGLDALAQTAAGLSFSLCGYLVARAGFLSMNAATAWLPWLLLASYSIAPFGFVHIPERQKAPDIVRILPLAVCIGLLLLAGHAQTAWYSLILLAVWVIFWSAQAGGWRRIGPALAELTGAALAGSLMAAVQLLPTLEYLLQSQRASAVDYSFAMNYSFWPWRFLTLLAPNFFGTPAQGNYWVTADNYWEDAVYIGLIPFILAVLVAARAFSRKHGDLPDDDERAKRGFTQFLIALVLIAFVLALGRYTPIFPFLYRHVPTFAMFQAPTRFSIWAEFGLVMLASMGFDGWRRPWGRGLDWVRRGLVAALAVSAGAGVAYLAVRNIELTFIRATVLAGLLGAAAAGLALAAPRRETAPFSRWHWAVIGVVAVDLLMAGWGLNPGIETQVYRQPAETASELRQNLSGRRLFLSAVDADAIMYGRFFVFNTFDPPNGWQDLRQVYLPNANSLDQIASANNFDPLLPARYVRWMEAVNKTSPAARQQMLAFMNVGLVEVPSAIGRFGVDFVPVSGAARLHWFSCATSAPNEAEAWSQTQELFSPDGGLHSRVVLEGISPDFLPRPDCNLTKPAEFRIIKELANQSEIQVSAPELGWLVLADIWYPGWEAAVDGNPVEILRADATFRAVAVPAGDHVVILKYSPRSFLLGAGVSAATIVSGVAAAVWLLGKRKLNQAG